MDIVKALNEIELRTKDLKHEYEQYFAGERRTEPQKDRKKIQEIIRLVTAQHVSNTGTKFRFQSLQATFNAYQRLWDRILVQIENGTYAPHRFKADTRVGKLDHETDEVLQHTEEWKRVHDNGQVRPDPVRELFDEYVDARRRTGDTAKLSYDAFRASLEKQMPVLKEKLGGPVRFKVSIEDGRAKLKGVRAS
ncbi:hypothetical protein K8I61_18665 [bacterium]|nr:hypothetical protein [bacterium]